MVGKEIRIGMTIAGLLGAAWLSALASVATLEDAIPALIEQKIQAYSEASAKGDQAAMDGLLDEEVLFAPGDGTVQHDEKFDKNDAVSALLKQQTLAFRDAQRRGDTAAMQGYLDDEVLFVDQAGVVLRRREVLGRVAKTSSTEMSDWLVHYSGNLAVTSFAEKKKTLSVETPVAMSVETWIKRGTAWKLTASQTIAIHHDPPSIPLSEGALNEYAGWYAGGPGFTVVISHVGSGLTSSVNGAKAVAYEPEGGDVFFSPGLPPGPPRSRIRFQRDASEHITGYVSSRGVVLTRSAAAPAAAQTPPGITSTILPAKDLVVQHSGDVAVATFIHERVTNFYGQAVHVRYRSTETWGKRGPAWKMLALQSCEVNDSPPALFPVTG